MKKPIPHYSIKDQMIEDIIKQVSDLPTDWGKPAPGGKSAEMEKKGDKGMTEEKAQYKTGYSNPKCRNRENKDCSIGEVNSDGLCKNCSYAPKRSAK